MKSNQKFSLYLNAINLPKYRNIKPPSTYITVTMTFKNDLGANLIEN